MKRKYNAFTPKVVEIVWADDYSEFQTAKNELVKYINRQVDGYIVKHSNMPRRKAIHIIDGICHILCKSNNITSEEMKVIDAEIHHLIEHNNYQHQKSFSRK